MTDEELANDPTVQRIIAEAIKTADAIHGRRTFEQGGDDMALVDANRDVIPQVLLPVLSRFQEQYQQIGVDAYWRELGATGGDRGSALWAAQTAMEQAALADMRASSPRPPADDTPIRVGVPTSEGAHDELRHGWSTRTGAPYETDTAMRPMRSLANDRSGLSVGNRPLPGLGGSPDNAPAPPAEKRFSERGGDESIGAISEAVDQAVRAFMTEHLGVSYAHALDHVRDTQPDLWHRYAKSGTVADRPNTRAYSSAEVAQSPRVVGDEVNACVRRYMNAHPDVPHAEAMVLALDANPALKARWARS